MKRVEPKFFVIAETKLNVEEVDRYLAGIGSVEYRLPGAPDAQQLTEVCGRVCYRSFEPGLNANVTKVRKDHSEYLANVIRSGHGSVLEHASVTFLFTGVSRVFTHELVRHRAGSAFSQESLRYVRLTDLGLFLPEETLRDVEGWLEEKTGSGQAVRYKAVQIIEDTFRALEMCQHTLAQISTLDDEDLKMPFSLKKKLTSLFRRVAPIGLATSIVWTTNHRNLRHVLTMRSSRHAEEEMRAVFEMVGDYCLEHWPDLYGDFEVELVDGYREFKPKHEKV